VRDRNCVHSSQAAGLTFCVNCGSFETTAAVRCASSFSVASRTMGSWSSAYSVITCKHIPALRHRRMSLNVHSIAEQLYWQKNPGGSLAQLCQNWQGLCRQPQFSSKLSAYCMDFGDLAWTGPNTSVVTSSKWPSLRISCKGTNTAVGSIAPYCLGMECPSSGLPPNASREPADEYQVFSSAQTCESLDMINCRL
jgi:hypothetical protein